MASVSRRPLLGLLLLVVAALVAGSVFSSPPWPGANPVFGLPANACGRMGAALAGFLLGYLGAPITASVWTCVVALAARGLFGSPRSPWVFLGWSVTVSFVLSVFVSGIGAAPYWGSGPASVSAWLASGARLGPVGAALLSGGCLTLLVFWAVPRWTPTPALDLAGNLTGGARDRLSELPASFAGLAGRARGSAADVWDRMPSVRMPSLFGPREPGLDEHDSDDEPIPASAGGRAARALASRAGDPEAGGVDSLGRRPVNRVRVSESVAEALRSKAAPDTEVLAAVSGAPRAAFGDEEWEEAEEFLDASTTLGDDEGDEDEFEMDDDGISPVLVPRPARARPPRKPKRHSRRGIYKLPGLDLLDAPRPRLGTVTEAEVFEKSRILVKTLEDFGIQGTIGEVHPGPVITQYEYAPAAGVRISQIVSRSDDIALNLRAARIRIVAPIPGKAAIGIEVPNDHAEHIDFRSVLEDLDLRDAHLPLCLGRDIRGRAQYGRLEKMPHLLVAGTTGSGKSVCLNTCLFSLLYNKTPEELRLLMIDPKMLELTVYDGIPHLLCPVVTDARTAARMLQWMVGEMERRYRKMATFGVRNIEGYHEKMKDKKIQREAEPMPYIVVVVDELADLMLTLGNEIETPIARLAQMARAVGIHLILATQRPSVDVITGVIKANFPGRIAFQVATKVDSRTIIDMNGAQDLLGKGDMLYLPPGQGKCVRLHGCFVSDQDAERLVEFLKEMPEPESIFREEMLDKEGDGADIDDDLFEDALRLVVFQKQASVSFIQRRLKVGYSRAGRLMDLLEGVGAVGPHEGSKPREVLADEAFLEEWLARENSIAGK